MVNGIGLMVDCLANTVKTNHAGRTNHRCRQSRKHGIKPNAENHKHTFQQLIFKYPHQLKQVL